MNMRHGLRAILYCSINRQPVRQTYRARKFKLVIIAKLEIAFNTWAIYLYN